ncbi:MAG: nitroreductase family deazaflavin-dependent oxidoreductase [SAR202 cluster bacterium]|nr:nitroreductase family deazaflavin-dependent oxidoreductase [Chloroflexota bacterium]MDP6422103.1 nitroreductase family deazaflavin-dependent oxidoreductase [SAR202 cluster bacterium]HAL46994.1 nitroreductase family deazaflavin-dependent oxidoreductase [Dehalococcoidia bacterium]MDP6664307.1 nitroreductase family deazaflavin-dependent oxidoreductase [SAR202 cluster bacterium]MDP6798783.1 nitroreductase family deazaflavin-dependent oxidoreductase [SAR202 cluster bacterium]|tara:strand:- start:6738 stop:7115 length:378 start_codon:yes stop_codon:yes gene_type:complete
MAEFRENDGKVGGGFEGSPLLILTTKGARSGQTRENPLMYLPDGDRMFVFASKAGGPTSPDWYHNLVANPDASVEVGAETVQVKATVLTADERDSVYAKQAALYPQFAEYQAKTTRTIPVVALDR